MSLAIEMFDPAKTSPYSRFTSGAAAARAQKSPLCPRPSPPNVNRSMTARVRTAEETVSSHREMLNSNGEALADLCSNAKQVKADFEVAIVEEQMRREQAAEEATLRGRLTLVKDWKHSSFTANPLNTKASSKPASLKTAESETWASGMGARWSPLVRHWAADTEPASPITTQEVGQRRRTTLFSNTALSMESTASPNHSHSRSQSNLSSRRFDSSNWKGLTHSEIWDIQYRPPVSEPVSPIVLSAVGNKRRDLLFRKVKV